MFRCLLYLTADQSGHFLDSACPKGPKSRPAGRATMQYQCISEWIKHGLHSALTSTFWRFSYSKELCTYYSAEMINVTEMYIELCIHDSSCWCAAICGISSLDTNQKSCKRIMLKYEFLYVMRHMNMLKIAKWSPRRLYMTNFMCSTFYDCYS